MSDSSTPSFSEFDPDIIKYQRKVIRLIKKEFDYSLGTLEILLSGSVGSAKSVLLAHLAVLHCLQYPRARVLLGRKALPDLKETIYQKIIEHMEGSLKEGLHYKKWDNVAKIKFSNGSEIISRSWIDKKYKKFRSLELSMAIFEELTENNLEDKQAFDEIKMRVGRLPKIPENVIVAATNPDAPSHWAYKYFMLSKKKTRFVFYSVTTDNPFLPKSYIQQLKADLDPKLAQRMIYGQWIEIASEVIYYEYDIEKNHIDEDYKPDPRYPIWIGWDFNIGLGKPLSAAVIQEIDGKFHIYGEKAIEGMRTQGSCEELAEAGYLDHPNKIYIGGDATGKARDTRGKQSDWDIIKKFLSNYTTEDGRRLDFEMRVPVSNPRIRDRHNIMNAYCCNANNERRLFTYKGASTAHEGMRLTKLKKGSKIEEDDSPTYQHITTAIGYVVYRSHHDKLRTSEQGTRFL